MITQLFRWWRLLPPISTITLLSSSYLPLISGQIQGTRNEDLQTAMMALEKKTMETQKVLGTNHNRFRLLSAWTKKTSAVGSIGRPTIWRYFPLQTQRFLADVNTPTRSTDSALANCTGKCVGTRTGRPETLFDPPPISPSFCHSRGSGSTWRSLQERISEKFKDLSKHWLYSVW